MFTELLLCALCLPVPAKIAYQSGPGMYVTASQVLVHSERPIDVRSTRVKKVGLAKMDGREFPFEVYEACE